MGGVKESNQKSKVLFLASLHQKKQIDKKESKTKKLTHGKISQGMLGMNCKSFSGKVEQKNCIVKLQLFQEALKFLTDYQVGVMLQ